MRITIRVSGTDTDLSVVKDGGVGKTGCSPLGQIVLCPYPGDGMVKAVWK